MRPDRTNRTSTKSGGSISSNSATSHRPEAGITWSAPGHSNDQGGPRGGYRERPQLLWGRHPQAAGLHVNRSRRREARVPRLSNFDGPGSDRYAGPARGDGCLQRSEAAVPNSEFPPLSRSACTTQSDARVAQSAACTTLRACVTLLRARDLSGPRDPGPWCGAGCAAPAPGSCHASIIFPRAYPRMLLPRAYPRDAVHERASRAGRDSPQFSPGSRPAPGARVP